MTTIPPDKVDVAARALATAVQSYLDSKPSGNGRRTTQGWTKIVAQSLGRQRVSRTIFDQVIQSALETGLLVKRASSGGRERLFPGPQLVMEVVTDFGASTDSIDRAVSSNPKEDKKGVPKKKFPADGKCQMCGWSATACLHCKQPAFDDDIYADSKGRWMCGSCNNLCFSESWGGLKRWKQENESDVELTNPFPLRNSPGDPEDQDGRCETSQSENPPR